MLLLPIATLLLALGAFTVAIPRPVQWELHQLMKRGGSCSTATKDRIAAGVKGIDKSIAYTEQEGFALNRIDSAERAERSRHVKLPGAGNHKKRAVPDVAADAGMADDGVAHGGLVVSLSPAVHRRANKEITQKTNALKTTFNEAVSQRKANQHTLPSSSPAQADLTEYGNRQNGAKTRIYSLTGDYSKDKADIKALRAGFAGGLQLNEKAKTDALSQCKRDLERLAWIQENVGLPEMMTV